LKISHRIPHFFFQSDPELFDSIHIFKKYLDLLKLLQRNQSPEEVIKEFMEKVLDDHPQKDIINLDLYAEEGAKSFTQLAQYFGKK
jgi:hypothetical protein